MHDLTTMFWYRSVKTTRLWMRKQRMRKKTLKKKKMMMIWSRSISNWTRREMTTHN